MTMKDRWIKVSDRLPEEGQMVMIIFWNGVVHTGSLINGTRTGMITI